MGDLTDMSNERDIHEDEDIDGICADCGQPWELCECYYEDGD